jgi:methyltransferase (TIGR00027 family)
MIQDVTDTAFMVAAYRALESERPDALFSDPLARRLAGERGAEIARDMDAFFLGGWLVAIRTVLIDDFVRSAVARGADAVLNLGAGLDARPYRLDLPEGLRWIEADFARVIEYKDARLSGEAPRCRLERVKIDLSDAAARREFFADVGSRFRRVLVLTEGVVPYLSNAQAGELADDLRAQPAFANWIVDYFSPETARYRKRAALAGRMKNAPFRFDPPDYLAFFAARGWRREELRYIAEEAERFGRPAPLPALVRGWLRLKGFFMTRARRENFRRFAGFAVFGRA